MGKVTKIIVFLLFVATIGLGVFFSFKNNFNYLNSIKAKQVTLSISTASKQEEKPADDKPAYSPMLDLAITPINKDKGYFVDELTSPDSRWYFAGLKYFGKEPLSRDYYWRLEFISMTGEGNRYVHLNWFERPEDGAYFDRNESVHPLGWSGDGRYVYFADAQPLSNIIPNLPERLSGYWAPITSAHRCDLGQSNGFEACSLRSVAPEGATSSGHLLDLLGKENRALWFEPAYIPPPCGKEDLCGEISAPPRLIYYDPTNGKASEEIADFKLGSKATIISASLDRDAKVKRAAYVVHENGESDLAYLYENDGTTKTTTKMDLGPYAKDIAKNGITSPYRLVVEKTAMDLPDGLFLVVIGNNNQIMYFRFDKLNDKWTVLFNKDGLL